MRQAIEPGVPGLRRREVATLADVSVEYYAKLERGNLAGVSPGLTLTIYSAEPGSPSAEGLRLLASWAATQAADSPLQPLSAS